MILGTFSIDYINYHPQILVFNDVPGLYSILGASLMVIVIFTSGFVDIIDNLPDESKFKMWCHSKILLLAPIRLVADAAKDKCNEIEGNK